MAAAKTSAKKSPVTQAEVTPDEKPDLVMDSEETVPERAEIKSKSATRRIEAIEEDIQKEAEKGVQVAKEDIEEAVHSPEVENLKDFSVDTLREMHDAAIVAEDAIKRELYRARNSAANMSTKIDDVADREIIVLKKKAIAAHERIDAIEEALEGELKDIWGTTFGHTRKVSTEN